MRRLVAAAAVVAAGSLLAGCGGGSAARVAGCDIDVTTPELVADREAAGITDCADVATRAGASRLPDIRLDCLGGTTGLSLADVPGPAVINFWSTVCVPCRKEMPVLEQFQRAYGDQVTLLGVNYRDTYPAAAIDFARIAGATYPSVADACGALDGSDVNITGLPRFLFVRADGSWTQAVGGVEDLDSLVALVEKNLGTTLAAPAGASS